MNSRFLASLILGVLPLTMMAQDDDMYFVPSKKSTTKATTVRPVAVRPAPVYYSGSNRNVDEYNRRGGSSYEVIPVDTTGKGNDIIDFNGEVGVYPDSLQQAEDFELTREMSRWDGYEPAVTYLEGYRDGRRDAYWHSPWFYSYYPWYDAWYDPWYGYRGWYSTLYDPWFYDPWYYDRYYYGGYYGYYGYYGWRRPYYYTGVHVVTTSPNPRLGRERRMVANTQRGVTNGRTSQFASGTFGGAALDNRGSLATRSNRTTTTTNGTRVTNSHGTFAGNRVLGSSNNTTNRVYNNTTTTTNSNRTSSGSFGGGGISTRNSSSSMGGGGSFGGGGGGGVSTRGGSRSSRR